MNVTFIGGGNMAQAIIGGLLRKRPADVLAQNIRVVDIDPATRAKVAREFGVSCLSEPPSARTEDEIIVLAVKPQNMREAATALRLAAGERGPHGLVISIAAGVRLADLSRWLGGHTRLVRAMPNTPALIGEGITALCPFPQRLDEEDLARAERILGAAGRTVRIADEREADRLLDAVTAVSGSGPAYVFFFMEAIEQAALDLELPRDTARALVLQTFVGAARLAAESPDPLSLLRQRVTSKGGTTEAALQSMAADGVKDAIVRAVKAACLRGKELGDQLGGEKRGL
jgi:pyrroline-5-carboxylate reductase